MIPTEPSSPRPASATRTRRILAAPFVALITLYRWTLSPVLGGHCRFFPSCSVYALEAYRSHNVVRATRLTAGRLLRCHPWGGKGYDPVPGTGPRSSADAALSDAPALLRDSEKSSASAPDKNARTDR